MESKDLILKKEISDLLRQCNIWFMQSRLNPQARIILNQILKRLKEIDSMTETSSKNHLSKREKEILQHVANGFSNREIGSALEISEKTIEYHLKSIFNKVEATSRTEAVSVALRKGWI